MGSKAGSKILFDVAGANHFEPTSFGKNSEVPAVALFLSCHLRNENCDKVYGTDGKAICKQIYAGDTLGDCRVEGGKSEDIVVPSPSPSPSSQVGAVPLAQCIPAGHYCHKPCTCHPPTGSKCTTSCGCCGVCKSVPGGAKCFTGEITNATVVV